MFAKNSRVNIAEKLCKKYEDAACELEFQSPFELLVAVILSAQCTDKRVNQVTRELFKKYNTPAQFAALSESELESFIRPCGFYHNKAKNIIRCAKDICARFNGQVPSDKQSLKSLAGVGEKTANVVLATAFQTPAIAVDTHVFRVSQRLGLAKGKNVGEVQQCLEELPERLWAQTHYSLVLLGRYVCKARRPQCKICDFKNDCEFYAKSGVEKITIK